MNTKTVTVINGRDLTIGTTVIHPVTCRAVTLIEEMGMEGDNLRRFLVQGARGGYDALVIGETSPVEAV